VIILILVVINLVNCLRVKPGDALAMLPEAVLNFAFSWILVDAETMLLAIVPPALILSTICPEVEAKPCLLILLVLAFVSDTIGVDINSHTVHVIVVPVAVVLASIFPLVLAYSVDTVVNPVTLINRPVGPGVSSISLFLAVLVLAYILRSFRPHFSALSRLGIVLPVTLVASSLLVGVDSVAIALVIVPLPVIDITISVVERSITAGVPHLPFSLVFGTVCPGHDASSISETSSHHAFEDGSGGRIRVPCLISGHVGVIFLILILEGFKKLLSFEIDPVGHLKLAVELLKLLALQESSYECLKSGNLINVKSLETSIHTFEVEMLSAPAYHRVESLTTECALLLC